MKLSLYLPLQNTLFFPQMAQTIWKMSDCPSIHFYSHKSKDNSLSLLPYLVSKYFERAVQGKLPSEAKISQTLNMRLRLVFSRSAPGLTYDIKKSRKVYFKCFFLLMIIYIYIYIGKSRRSIGRISSVLLSWWQVWQIVLVRLLML